GSAAGQGALAGDPAIAGVGARLDLRRAVLRQGEPARGRVRPEDGLLNLIACPSRPDRHPARGRRQTQRDPQTCALHIDVTSLLSKFEAFARPPPTWSATSPREQPVTFGRSSY